MAALNMNEGAAAATIDSNDNNNNSPTSPPRLVNIAIDSSLDINNNIDNNNAISLPTPTNTLQDIKEESYNETESAVERINQLSFSSPITTKMTTLCNNTIGSSTSSSTNDNKLPTDDDNTNASNNPTAMISDTNNSSTTQHPPSSDSTLLQNESSKLDITITVLSLHGIISKHVDKKSSSLPNTTTSRGSNNNIK